MKKRLLTVALCGALSFTGCTTVAEIVGADSETLNQQSSQFFDKTVAEAKAKQTLDTHSAVYKRINQVFHTMRPYADRVNKTGQTFAWQLAVIKSKDVNAYVSPGGKIVFFTGIVEKLNLTDAEIAAIMGHEMTHALEEHAKRQIGAETLTSLTLGIGAAAAGLGDAGLQLASAASHLGVSLPYSRNLETQADKGGLMLMAAAGFDPRAAVSAWEKMKAHSDKDGIPTFLSTHPSDEARLKAMQKLLPEALKVYQQR